MCFGFSKLVLVLGLLKHEAGYGNRLLERRGTIGGDAHAVAVIDGNLG